MLDMYGCPYHLPYLFQGQEQENKKIYQCRESLRVNYGNGKFNVRMGKFNIKFQVLSGKG